MSKPQVDQIVRAVAELPDRNSPEDWPEAMLVTADELRQILVDAELSRPETEAELRARFECRYVAYGGHYDTIAKQQDGSYKLRHTQIAWDWFKEGANR
jgi:hypothetical protein